MGSGATLFRGRPTVSRQGTAFDFSSPAELFLSRRRGRHTEYRRFATAAEAISHAVGNLSTRRSLSAWMLVGDERFKTFLPRCFQLARRELSGGRTTSELLHGKVKNCGRHHIGGSRTALASMGGNEISGIGRRYSCPKRVCAVTRRRFPVGASPTRQPLQPEAIGAVMEVTKWLKPSISVSRIGGSASVQAATRVNAEQASKRTMRRPTRQTFRGRLLRPDEMSEVIRPDAAPG